VLRILVSCLIAVFVLLPAGLFVSANAVKPDLRFVNANAAELESRYVNIGDVRVHYKTAGAGSQAIVFVHGWTCDHTFWLDQAPAFEKKARVILIDLPGHGLSDKPPIISYNQDLFARAVAAAMRDAGVQSAVLVGHSMGTPVIRQFYRKFPAMTRGLVIVDGALRPFASNEMMKQIVAPLRGPNYLETAEGLIEGMLGPNVSPALKGKIKSSMLSTPQHVAVSAMEGMMDPVIWTEDRINVPVLAVLAKSPFWPADNEAFFKKIAPKLEYHMWDGVSHFLMMEKPKEFGNLLSAFIDKHGLLKK
jgi:pimeloyl-ACP methyl ester carboxylesterase